MNDVAFWERYHRVLRKAMRSRANGTRHLDSCRNVHVNASWYPCSDPCREAQDVLLDVARRAGIRKDQPSVRKVKT